jgi:hypothetical protein
VVSAVAASLVVAAGVATVALRRPADPVVPPGAPIAAVLRAAPGPVTVGAPLAVGADVISGAPLASVQLWAGGAVADEVAVAGQRRVTENLEFTPREVGSHLLVLRVVDDAGRVAHAAPLRVRARAPVAPLASSGGATGPAVNAPALRRVAHTAALAGPGVTVATAGCDATVRATPDARFAEVALFGLGPGDAGFKVLGYGAGGVTVPLTAGENAVYALGFDEHGSAPSDITMVRAPDECASKRWQGTVSLVEGVLRAPGQPSLAYLYLTVDGGQWQRVPAADQTFVRRDQHGQLDFGQHLPSLDGVKKIEIEAWTRQGGKATLLGRGTLEAKGGSAGTMPALVGFIPATPLDQVLQGGGGEPGSDTFEMLVRKGEIHTYTAKAPPGAQITVATLGKPTGPYTFRWKPPIPSVTHAVWQVSMAPSVSAPTLNQPGLLASQPIPVSDTDFEIDFRPLVLPDYVPPTPPKKVPSLGFDDVVPQKYVQLPPGGAGGGGGGGGAAVTQVGNPGLTPAQIVHAVEPPKLYVRLVPMVNGQPVDAVSNPVTYTMFYEDLTPPNNKLPLPPAITVDVKFSRPSLYNPAWTHCVMVVHNPDPELDNTGFSGKAKPGDRFCPIYPDDDPGLLGIVTGAFELAVDLWDMIVEGYAWIKKQAVNFIVAATGCSQIPELKSACATVAEAAIDAALASVGIPPGLPSSDALFAAAKGQLVEGAYAMAAANNVDCSVFADKCKELMGQALDGFIDFTKDQVSDAAKAQASAGGGAIALHPDIVVAPYPGGQNQPAAFVVTYRRTPAAVPANNPLPTTCLTGGNVFGKRDNWTWTDFDLMHDTGATAEQAKKTETVDGKIYEGVNTETVNLAALKPGEKVTRMLVLNTPLVWFEDGADPVVGENDGKPGSTVINSDVNHYGTLMEQPAVLTASIFGCRGKTVDTWVAPPHGWSVP